jgi:hypothetical protein
MVLIFLGLVFAAALLGAALVATVVGAVIRAALWLVFLPFRLVFLALGLPFLAVGLVFTILAVVGGGLLIGAGVVVAALLSALLPLAVVVFLGWALVRLVSRGVAMPIR